ncbi:MAG: sigma-70 family RNA polymerase sigma factor [Phycisphaerae bacterium]|nr:sigma-70 family RNA polymerase sigma factor [Phycisphaerae bacterium]
MNNAARHDVTLCLTRVTRGDRAAADELLPLVYNELRALAQTYLGNEARRHTLQPTALVHEVYLRLVEEASIDWKGRAHFFAVAAKAMRQLLVDYARAKQAEKRGGGWHRVTLDQVVAPTKSREVELLSLDEALTKLAQLDPVLNKIVELRFFGGLTIKETAEVLELSTRTVKREWSIARAWLNNELRKGEQE